MIGQIASQCQDLIGRRNSGAQGVRDTPTGLLCLTGPPPGHYFRNLVQTQKTEPVTVSRNLNSFDARTELTVDGNAFAYYSLPRAAVSGAGDISRLPFSLKIMLENLLRHEDGVTVSAGDVTAVVESATGGPSEREIRLPPRTGADAGLHGRAGRRRPGGHAGRHWETGRSGGPHQSPAGRGPGHRPLCAGGRVRLPPGLRGQRGPGIRPQPGTVSLSEMGTAGLRQLPRRPARHGHCAPGQSRIPGEGGLHPGTERGTASPIPIPWWARIPIPP